MTAYAPCGVCLAGCDGCDDCRRVGNFDPDPLRDPDTDSEPWPKDDPPCPRCGEWCGVTTETPLVVSSAGLIAVMAFAFAAGIVLGPRLL